MESVHRKCRCKVEGQILKSKLEDLLRLHESTESEWVSKYYPATLRDSLKLLRDQSWLIDQICQVQQLIDVFEACDTCRSEGTISPCVPLELKNLKTRDSNLPDFLTGSFTKPSPKYFDPTELIYSAREESVFVRNPLKHSKPPVKSLFDEEEDEKVESTSKIEPDCREEELWLLVYGFPNNYAGFIESFLEQLVTVVQMKPGRGNWMFVRVLRRRDVEKALVYNGKLINSSIMIGICPYKEPKNEYEPDEVEVDLQPVSVIRPVRRLRTRLPTKRHDCLAPRSYVRPNSCWFSMLGNVLFG